MEVEPHPDNDQKVLVTFEDYNELHYFGHKAPFYTPQSVLCFCRTAYNVPPAPDLPHMVTVTNRTLGLVMGNMKQQVSEIANLEMKMQYSAMLGKMAAYFEQREIESI